MGDRIPTADENHSIPAAILRSVRPKALLTADEWEARLLKDKEIQCLTKERSEILAETPPSTEAVNLAWLRVQAAVLAWLPLYYWKRRQMLRAQEIEILIKQRAVRMEQDMLKRHELDQEAMVNQWRKAAGIRLIDQVPRKRTASPTSDEP